MSTPIARRYAAAFYAFLRDEKNILEARAALSGLGDLIKTSQDLKAFLDNPLLVSEEKGKLLRNVFAGRLPAPVERFLQFINFKDRLGSLPDIIDAFEDLYLDKHDQIRAVVETAVGLNTQDRQAVIDQLKSVSPAIGGVIADFRLNPALLGGFRIWARGHLFDASIQTQLADFKQHACA